MDGFGENIPVTCFFHGSIDIPGAAEAFIRDLHSLSGNLMPVFHFLNGLSNIWFFRFVSWIHLHGDRHQIRVKEERLPDDWSVPVLLGGSFLFIFPGQIDLEIIIRTVKKHMAEISWIVLLITMVKELNVFLVGFTDKSQAIINLIF